MTNSHRPSPRAPTAPCILKLQGRLDGQHDRPLASEHPAYRAGFITGLILGSLKETPWCPCWASAA